LKGVPGFSNLFDPINNKMTFSESIRFPFPVFLLLLLPVLLTAQNVPPPPPLPPGVKSHPALLYIPYNDHGKWGWCDTLGNVTIPAKYEASRFFYPNKDEAGNPVIMAEVSTKVGKNYLVIGNGLMYPKKYGIASNWKISFPDSVTKEKFYYIKDKRGRYGLLSLSEGVVVKPTYDEISHEMAFYGLILLRKKGATCYDRYDMASRKMLTSDIVSHKVYRTHEKGKNPYYISEFINVITHAGGRLSSLARHGVLEPFTMKDNTEYAPNDMFIEEEPSFSKTYRAAPENDQKSTPDEVLTTVDYAHYGATSKRYGFTRLKLIRKDGKLGIVNEADSVIVPPAYDRIDLSEIDSRAMIFKDDKQGMKLFFTHYPLIEARYESIAEAHQLRVTERWVFAVFRVTKNNEHGYVGENAVEYFDLD